MVTLLIIIFVITYAAIAFEHPLKINKSASALLGAGLLWAIYALASTDYAQINQELSTSLIGTAQIVFFLMAAMAIVEVVDAHQGFDVVTARINTQSLPMLLWIICWVAFFLSSILDNLTTTIVMISLVRKLLDSREDRLFFAGMIVIAANAGGAWSPIGDVTTTMLWIGGQISAASIMKSLFIPSIVCAVVPLLFLTFTMKGTLGEFKEDTNSSASSIKTGNLMLILGVGALISVPIFKTVTHLPPYMGMLLGLGVLWVVSELINPDLDEAERKNYTASHALAKIDMPSVLFFLGILLAVGALQSMGTLANFAGYLSTTFGDNRIIITLIGLLSAVVDNVPLVAASMGMYSLEAYPMDDFIWTYLAYCAGTGGSILIIGSAAGVAAMGMEKIEFGWYLKRISLLAALGYFAGAGVYLLMSQL